MGDLQKVLNRKSSRREFFGGLFEAAGVNVFLRAALELGFIGEKPIKGRNEIDLLPTKENCLRVMRYIDRIQSSYDITEQKERYYRDLDTLDFVSRNIVEVILKKGSYLYQKSTFIASFTTDDDGQIYYYTGNVILNKPYPEVEVNLLILADFRMTMPKFRTNFFERGIKRISNDMLIVLVPSNEELIKSYYEFYLGTSLAAFKNNGYNPKSDAEILSEFLGILAKPVMEDGDIKRLKVLHSSLHEPSEDKKPNFFLDIIALRYLMKDRDVFDLTSFESFADGFKCIVTENNAINCMARILQRLNMNSSSDVLLLIATSTVSKAPFFNLTDMDETATTAKILLIGHLAEKLKSDLGEVMKVLLNMPRDEFIELCKEVLDRMLDNSYGGSYESIFDLAFLENVRSEIEKLDGQGIFAR